MSEIERLQEMNAELLAALKAAYKEMRLYLQRPAKSTTLQQIKAAIDKAEGR